MSQGQKLIERPKVRFCQPIPSEESSNSEQPDEQFNPNSNKPRIRSIVTLEEPFKLVSCENFKLPSTSKDLDAAKSARNSKSSSEAGFENPSSSSNLTSNPKTSGLKASSNKSQNTTQEENSIIVCDGDDKRLCEKSSKPCLPSTSNLKSQQSTTCKSGSKISATLVQNPLQVKSSGRSSASKLVSKHASPSTAKTMAQKPTNISDENKNPPTNSVSKISRPKEKTPGKVAQSSSRSMTTTNTKTVTCGLKISKPGTKVWKPRSKSSPVKKTILRDVTGRSTNAHVGPGVARYYSQPFKMNMDKETAHIRPDIVSGGKLGRPEYNSIMCTIDELKKAQEERIVTDVQHLPLVYRNLVNEKVSAALDFSPDEAIYRNLVDLSINENQLPSRVTRSKDPEPRHRDIVPKLSDFFTPTYSEEYRSAVKIRPSSPEVISTWSAFAISDKIFGWKHDMDNCC